MRRMTRHNPSAAFVLITLVAAGSFCRAEPAAELLDLAARIDYGFYTQEPALIAAARAELDAASGADAWRDYYHAFAALRLAQLGGERDRHLARVLEECLHRAEPVTAASRRQMAAEGWILVAACSGLAAELEPVQSVFHQRRLDQALDSAREMAPDNPRIRLIEAWRIDSTGRREATSSDRIAALEATVESFGLWAHRYELPDWGEAEAHALLGEAYLERDDVRRARDHIEQALILAPGYEYALELRRGLQSR